ncbi:phosphotransferase system, HPr-related protein [Pseudomonas otitidis]|uniref:Phosphotransferase system, HPr-related protein n=1 Tax=Metapseudomonas otitidis TaxID=319939 RepID=A0A7X3H7K5_9GAMM|nr:phosphotransferase system, HPr-related protein [Pseudomonas otitidis]MWK56637.1 phosphotransferase system, HPr-related protein [Pseudomonas otitidis]
MKSNKPSARIHEIDDIEDRMGSMEQLDFSERKDERQGRVGDLRSEEELEREFPDERVREAGMTGGETLGQSLHEDGVSDDDLSPETLIDENGERLGRGTTGSLPADKELSVVGADEIGAGGGLDEAEEGRAYPLDGKSWGGEAR